ncbi:MAG: DUF3089 domain-containing protein [Caulobacteraceae bacterium]
MIRSSLAALAIAATMVTGSARAQPAPLDHNDYSSPADWLCLPGRTGDACDVDLSATEVKADGAMTSRAFGKETNPAIDCFYVYPTVSTDPGVLATMKIEAAERIVIAQQFARFAAVCRPFAPVYRQYTLTGLIARLQGKPLPMAGVNPQTPYQDVLDAWNYYLAHDNHGRGVVLIGHSQGSGMLTQLIEKEVDGKPAQKLLVSAILMGTSLAVPKGEDVGGDFKHVPLCRSPSQLGCVIAFASFRDTSPPPADSNFGRPRIPGDDLVAACANPANLAGGEGPLKSYLASGSQAIAAAALSPGPWVEGKSVTTPFVTTPGLLTARCVSGPQFTYLAIHVNAQPGPRVKDIVGDVVVGGQIQKNWGLHLIDANLAMGNLIDIVGEESRAWVARR